MAETECCAEKCKGTAELCSEKQGDGKDMRAWWSNGIAMHISAKAKRSGARKSKGVDLHSLARAQLRAIRRSKGIA